MQKTPIHQLNQWDPSDRVLREDFNSDNRKIEAAIEGVPKVLVGSYRGTGDNNRQNHIPLGARPKAVYITIAGNSVDYNTVLITPDAPIFKNQVYLGQIEDNGFAVATTTAGGYAVRPSLNDNTDYLYLAIV